HSRHGAPAGADALPQFGSMARAVTRPDSLVDGPVWVTGSKNWLVSPTTLVLTGPTGSHAPGELVSARRYAFWVANAERPTFLGFASNALRPFRASLSSTYERG